MILLAKSQDVTRGHPSVSLTKHIDDCLLIFEFLKKGFPKVASISNLGADFWEALRTAVIFHDLGKAHIEFQKLLHRQRNNWNSQRHELFSIAFVDKFETSDRVVNKLIKLAVAGHHKDYETLTQKLRYYDTSDSFGMLDTAEDIQDFASAFNSNVQSILAYEVLREFGIELREVEPMPLDGLIRGYVKSPIRLNEEEYITLMMLVGGLKWCDHLGSGQIREFEFLEEDDFVFLDRKRQELLSVGKDFYKHQLHCATARGSTILIAPTGSGKTESALLWVKNQMSISGQGKIFYILPFTASINAMFERLSDAFGRSTEKVGMLHGKLRSYLNDYFDNSQYTPEEKRETIEGIRAKFRSVITPLKIVTPFQLLKHLFGLKGYEQGIFEMAGGYFILDEIHAYNPEVFAQIRVLLEFATKYLGVKVMVMSATIPKFLLAELEKCIGSPKIVKADNQLYSNLRRHRIVLKAGRLNESLSVIKDQLLKGKKVLVVCNTVRSSQRVFREIRDFATAGRSLLLHGGFSGVDRAKKEALLSSMNIDLLIGTQAIEVSLDIDYDVIFTEPAPIDALIQRFGRVNRKGEKGFCDCWVFLENNDDDFFIYNKSIIEKTLCVLERVVVDSDGLLDEAELQGVIDEVYPDWLEENKEAFDSQYINLITAMKLLSPMFRNKYTEEDFYRQFDGIKILPQVNKTSYEQCLQNFDFIGAESQKVSIRKGRFIQWKTNGYLTQYVLPLEKDGEILEEKCWITNKKYNSDLGLQADEEDPWEGGEIL